jgi:hypothetical protein
MSRRLYVQVSQLDAALLDEELASLLRHKLLSTCKHVQLGAPNASRCWVRRSVRLLQTCSRRRSFWAWLMRSPPPSPCGCGRLGRVARCLGSSMRRRLAARPPGLVPPSLTPAGELLLVCIAASSFRRS